MQFTLDETMTVPDKPFWLSRPIPCPVLPIDLENWIVERMPSGIRVAFVKRKGVVHAYHDKKCIDNWVFARMCIDYLKALPRDDFMIDGVLKPDGDVLCCVTGDRLGKFFAFDYVDLLNPMLPLTKRKKDLETKIGMMPETIALTGSEAKSPQSLENFFWVAQSFGDRGIVIKKKDSIYEAIEGDKHQVDSWQMMP